MPSGRSVQDEVDRPSDRAAAVDDARGPDADTEDRLVRAGEDLVDQVVDHGEGGVAVRAIEVVLTRWRTSPRRSSEGRGEGPLAEVEGDDVAGVVDERDEGRLLAAGAGAAPDFLGQALLLELADQLPDRVSSGR